MKFRMLRIVYYNQNTVMFSANQPHVQGLFMKVPNSSAQHLNNVRAWYRKDQDAIDKLEKFSIGNAVKL